MSVLTALYKSYLWAEENDLVDDQTTSGSVLLPIFHTSKKSNSDKEIVEYRLDKGGKFISAEMLQKDSVVVFPVTEASMKRSGNANAPHALCDELGYMCPEINAKGFEQYLNNITHWVEYSVQNGLNESLNAIYTYVSKGEVLHDFVSSIFPGAEYKIIKNKHVEIHRDGVVLLSKCEKIMVTFVIEENTSSLTNKSVTSDTTLHQNYIEYMENCLSDESESKSHCDISGQYTYCAERHRGVIANAKIISISNHLEAYYGRIHQGNDVIHVGFDTSQRIHLMLKFLLDNRETSRSLGETSRLVGWFSDDIYNKEGFNLLGDFSPNSIEQGYEDADDEFDDENQLSNITGGASLINRFILGENIVVNPASIYYLLIIDKISNGRVAIKYSRQITKSDLFNRVKDWHTQLEWKRSKAGKQESWIPSLSNIINAAYGEETTFQKNTILQIRNKKLRSKLLERLIPCIIEGRKFPRDIRQRLLSNLYNRVSYGDSWNWLINVACAIFKKCLLEEKQWIGGMDVLDTNVEDRSYLFGRLLAVFEKAETDAMKSREGGEESSINDSSKRTTNAQRLWNAFVHNPEKTWMALESKMLPYWQRLQKNNPSSYYYYKKVIQEITDKLSKNLNKSERLGSLNEKFIFGYYGQRQDFYTKREKTTHQAND